MTEELKTIEMSIYEGNGVTNKIPVTIDTDVLISDRTSKYFGKITKITSAYGGNIIVSTGNATHKFTITGDKRSQDAWNHISMKPITPEHKAQLIAIWEAKKKLRCKADALKAVQWDKLPESQLLPIYLQAKNIGIIKE
jgi:hypothetical protein